MNAQASGLLPHFEWELDWARHVHELAGRLGLPARVAERVFLVKGDETQPLWLLDGDDMPVPESADLEMAAECGLGVMTSRTGSHALTAIASYLPHGSRLHVMSRSREIGDWALLEEATRLEDLVTNGRPRHPVDLTRLSRLSRLAIEGRKWIVDWDSREFRVLSLTGIPCVALPPISAPLEYLSIDAGRDLTSLAWLDDVSKLQSVFISGAGVFDASSLREATALVHVIFRNCRGVVNAQSLAELPRLRRLTFDNAGVVDPVSALRGLAVEVFEVYANRSFGPEFAEPGPGAVWWRVMPQRSVPTGPPTSA